VQIRLLTCVLHSHALSSHHDYSRYRRRTGPVRRGVSCGDHPGSSPIWEDHAGPNDVSGQTVLFPGRPGCMGCGRSRSTRIPLQTLEIERVTAGAVLYNGEQRFNVRSVRIFNPLLVEDIWETLTAPPEQDGNQEAGSKTT